MDKNDLIYSTDPIAACFYKLPKNRKLATLNSKPRYVRNFIIAIFLGDSNQQIALPEAKIRKFGIFLALTYLTASGYFENFIPAKLTNAFIRQAVYVFTN